VPEDDDAIDASETFPRLMCECPCRTLESPVDDDAAGTAGGGGLRLRVAPLDGILILILSLSSSFGGDGREAGGGRRNSGNVGTESGTCVSSTRDIDNVGLGADGTSVSVLWCDDDSIGMSLVGADGSIGVSPIIADEGRSVSAS